MRQGHPVVGIEGALVLKGVELREILLLVGVWQQAVDKKLVVTGLARLEGRVEKIRMVLAEEIRACLAGERKTEEKLALLSRNLQVD